MVYGVEAGIGILVTVLIGLILVTVVMGVCLCRRRRPQVDNKFLPVVWNIDEWIDG